MSPRGFVAYELKGESLDAAVTLDLRVREIMARAPVAVNGRSLLDIHLDYKRRYGDALDEIRRMDPDLLQKCGLDSPAVQVETYDGGHPRAYENYPAVYWTSAKQALYLMFCPVDHNGGHFVPAGAVRCADSDFTSTDMGHGIYKKHYWIAEGPVLDGGRRGVPLPANFGPDSHTVQGAGLKPDRCFKAGGDSLYAVERIAQEKALFDKTWKAFTDATQEWVKAQMPGHYAGFILRDDGQRNVLELSIRIEGSGASVPIDHPDWIIDRQMERDWRNPATGTMERVILNEYEARPNPVSPAGQQLYELFKAMPRFRATISYPDLTIQSAGGQHSPVIHTFPQGTYLAYHGIRADEEIQPPPGCTEVAPGELTWLDRDRTDRSWGIQPPPVPQALAHLYSAPGAAAPRPPQP